MSLRLIHRTLLRPAFGWTLLGILVYCSASMLLNGTAVAQAPVAQTGSVIPQHNAMWSTNGVIMDAGGAAQRPQGLQPTELGLVAPPNVTGSQFPATATGSGPNGENLCTYDAPLGQPGHYLCLSANLGGNVGALDFGSIAGGAAGTFQIRVNGVPINPSLSNGTILNSNISGGTGLTINPYTSVFPQGIGLAPLSYPDTSQYATDFITAGISASPSGTIIYNNQLPYGDLDTSCAGSFSIGSNRPCGSTGYTDLRQIASLQLQDAIALTTQADTIPPFGPFAGTFTATTFIPTTAFNSQNVIWPFQTNTSVTMQSLLKKGMWARTDTRPYWRGMISNPGNGTVGSPVTFFGFVQDGSSPAVYGTPPASGNLVINDTTGFYAGIDVVQGNGLCSGAACTAPTGSLTNSSTTVSSISNISSFFVGQFISSAHLAVSVITSINYGAGSLTVSGNGPAGIGGGGTATESLSVSASNGNQFRAREVDVNTQVAYGPYTPEKITGCAATLGSYQLTGCSSIPTDVRQWLGVLPSNGNIVSPAASVVSRDSTTSLTLNLPALSSGSVDLTFRQTPVEGGVGFDIAGPNNLVQAGISTRGTLEWGYKNVGAALSSFLVQPDATGPVPVNGFEVDCSIAGCPSGRAFLLGNRRLGTVTASVDPVGNIFGAGTGTFSTLSVPNGSGVGVPANYAANIHATTNANFVVGPGAFFSGVAGGIAAVAFQDNGSSLAEFALVGSQIDITATPKLYGQTTGASTQTFTNSPCAGLTTERWVPVLLNGVSGTWFVPACQ